MFTRVLPKPTQETLELLGKHNLVDNFYLSGGSACALYLGHRISEDLDFFTSDEFLPEKLRDELLQYGSVEVLSIAKNTLHCIFHQTRLSFLRYRYPLLEPLQAVYTVHVSSLVDVLCTKLDTVSSRGSKKDFIDLYCAITQGQYTLPQLIEAFHKKYAGIEYSVLHVLKGLIYFTDAEVEAMPTLVAPMSWEEVKTFFESEVRRLEKSILS